MESQRVDYILQKEEGLTSEFKRAASALPNNLFETVCAFLNRNGGTILLGITDEGEVCGVDENKIEQICKNLTNLSNNSSKLDPVFLLQPSIVSLGSKKIIHVFVPSSSQVHKTNGKCYDRGMDGDFVVTTHAKISELYMRKSANYSENTIYPFLNETHFEEGIVQKAKNSIRSNRPAHPWLELIGFLQSSRLVSHRFNVKFGRVYISSPIAIWERRSNHQHASSLQNRCASKTNRQRPLR